MGTEIEPPSPPGAVLPPNKKPLSPPSGRFSPRRGRETGGETETPHPEDTRCRTVAKHETKGGGGGSQLTAPSPTRR